MAYDLTSSRYKKFIGLSQKDKYFNSGVAVINIKNWKEKKCTERIINHIKNVKGNYPLVDQDLMNIVLKNEIGVLDMRYNYLSGYNMYDYKAAIVTYEMPKESYYSKDQWIEARQAIICHFAGQGLIRPWYSNSKNPFKKEYDKYYEMSPWRNQKQEKGKMAFPYKVQYILWRLLPPFVFSIASLGMQRIYMKLQYNQ